MLNKLSKLWKLRKGGKLRKFMELRELRKYKKGEILKTTGDYDTRQGICAEPVSLRETFSFTVTHKVKLCSCQGGSSSPLLFFLLQFVEGSFD